MMIEIGDNATLVLIIAIFCGVYIAKKFIDKGWRGVLLVMVIEIGDKLDALLHHCLLTAYVIFGIREFRKKR